MRDITGIVDSAGAINSLVAVVDYIYKGIREKIGQYKTLLQKPMRVIPHCSNALSPCAWNGPSLIDDDWPLLLPPLQMRGGSVGGDGSSGRCCHRCCSMVLAVVVRRGG